MPRLSYCRNILTNGRRCSNEVTSGTPFCYRHTPATIEPPSVSSFIARVLTDSRIPNEHLSTVATEFCEALPQIEQGFRAAQFMLLVRDGPSELGIPRFDEGVMDGILRRTRNRGEAPSSEPPTVQSYDFAFTDDPPDSDEDYEPSFDEDDDQ